MSTQLQFNKPYRYAVYSKTELENICPDGWRLPNVEEWKKDVNPLGRKEEFKSIWIPYGLPEIVDPHGTKYGIGVEVQPAWDIPRKVFISQTVVGAFYSTKGNPAHPVKAEEIRDQALLINGEPVRDSWSLRRRYYNQSKLSKKKTVTTVPADSYFVLGDYSATSQDSRHLGCVPRANLIGKAFKRIYPFNRSGSIE